MVNPESNMSDREGPLNRFKQIQAALSLFHWRKVVQTSIVINQYIHPAYHHFGRLHKDEKTNTVILILYRIHMLSHCSLQGWQKLGAAQVRGVVQDSCLIAMWVLGKTEVTCKHWGGKCVLPHTMPGWIPSPIYFSFFETGDGTYHLILAGKSLHGLAVSSAMIAQRNQLAQFHMK